MNRENTPRSHSAPMQEEAISSNTSYAATATWLLTIQWNHLAIFPSISSHSIGTKRRNKTQGEKEKGKELGDDKERTALIVQARTLMTIYRRNTNKYPGYVENLSLICQRGM